MGVAVGGTGVGVCVGGTGVAGTGDGDAVAVTSTAEGRGLAAAVAKLVAVAVALPDIASSGEPWSPFREARAKPPAARIATMTPRTATWSGRMVTVNTAPPIRREEGWPGCSLSVYRRAAKTQMDWRFLRLEVEGLALGNSSAVTGPGAEPFSDSPPRRRPVKDEGLGLRMTVG